jgi:hypothetical protein
MKGTIVENSLADKSVLDSLHIMRTWSDEDWILHDVVVGEEHIKLIQKALCDGPWYVHFWEGDDITVVYKNRVFTIKKLDTSTWKEAIEYGASLGIPEEQLDFLTD